MANYNTTTSDYPRSHVAYDAISLTTSGTIIDYSLKENTTLFDRITVIREMTLRNTLPVYVKLNVVTNAAIELLEGEGINSSGLPIEDIFITAVSGTLVRIFGVGWN